MRQAIATGNQAFELLLTLQLAEPASRLLIRGFDPERDWSVYFDRRAGTPTRPLPAGPVTLAFPLPISPTILDVVATARGLENQEVAVRLEHCGSKELPTRPLLTQEQDQQWLSFAIYLALNLPYLELTRDERYPYQSEEGFLYRVLRLIRNRETGVLLNTPARINRRTGVLEVSVEQMLHYTIPMRVVVLLHEYIHVRDQTDDEQACDEGALRLFTAAGFPLSEGLYAFSKVFDKRPELMARVHRAAQQLLDYDQVFRLPSAAGTVA